ncbi:MAG: hypothetical protein ACOC83_09180 [Gemmatimonadota bacterium]
MNVVTSFIVNDASGRPGVPTTAEYVADARVAAAPGAPADRAALERGRRLTRWLLEERHVVREEAFTRMAADHYYRIAR